MTEEDPGSDALREEDRLIAERVARARRLPPDVYEAVRAEMQAAYEREEAKRQRAEPAEPDDDPECE